MNALSDAVLSERNGTGGSSKERRDICRRKWEVTYVNVFRVVRKEGILTSYDLLAV